MNHKRHEKHEKKQLVPKLRFPEFLDTGEWSTREFKDLIEIIEKRAGTKKYTLMSVTAGVGLVSQLEKFGREIAGNAYKNYYVIKKGDFAYNKSATKQFPEGYIAMLTEHDKAALPNSIFTCFRITDENTCSKIFDHLFHANYHGSWLRKFIAVGARAHGSLNVDTKHLLDMPVVLPKLPEQQKITDCLTSLDELITAEAGKLEAYKAHKKGLMQKLFPAEGEAVPQWRFPEFRGKGGWDVEELSEKTDKVGSGITPKGGDKNYKTSGRPFVRSQNVGWGYLILNDVAYIDENTHASFLATEIAKDDVLLNITGASIGRSAVADHHIAGGNVNQHVCIIRTKTKKLNPIFLNQFILSDCGQNQIDSFQAGGNRQGLNFAQIRSFLIPIPPNIEEQQKIADCLTSLDELIIAQSKKIDTLKTHKKGLMQGLFPSAEVNI